jgi:RND superfamily putative drug exporter
MEKFLYKLGKSAYSHKWWVIGAWLAVLVAACGLALAYAKPASTSISVPGTAAEQTLNRMNELFPAAGKSSGRIVFAAKGDSTIASHKAAIEHLAMDISSVQGVKVVISPFAEGVKAISVDGKTAFLQVQLANQPGSVDSATLSDVAQLVAKARLPNLTIEIGGDLNSPVPGSIIGDSETLGVLFAVIILVIVLGTVVLAGLPILVAVLGAGVSIAGLFALSQVVEINSTTPALAVMLGLAVGIDYSLFIINRYKNHLVEGNKPQKAAALANGAAGRAVVFAASTVCIALLGLTAIGIPFMSVMGVASAATVAIVALAAITLVPALLGATSDRVARFKSRPTSNTWHKTGTWLAKHSAVAIVGALVVVAAVAWPVGQLKLGLPSDEYAAANSTRHKAYDLMEKGFGTGSNAPILLLVEGLPNVPNESMKFYTLAKLSGQLAKLDGVASAQPMLATSDGANGVVQLIPTDSPSSPKTDELIETLRNEAKVKDLLGGLVTLRPTGTSVLMRDINAKLAAALPTYLTIVVCLSIIVLLIHFRSVLIPIKATLGFLLSVLAMFGALVAVFQWGWLGIADAPAPIVSFVPIVAIGVLFGLAMDYEFFLVSSMAEEYKRTKNARLAVVNGFGLAGKVVTAAGIIMASVFTGFVFNDDRTIASIGFALAIGVLIDAFIVRMIMVPAAMALLGKAAWWWPRRKH